MDCAPRLFLFTAALMAVTPAAWAQRAPAWRVYRVADGLAESACLAVTVSPQGKVVARHFNLRSLSELDGYGIKTVPVPDNSHGRIYESPAGQFWTTYPDGLQEYRNNSWLLHPVPEVASALRTGGSQSIDPAPLCPV